MNNKGIAIFLGVDAIILFALILTKTVLFFKAARKKTLKRWFFFSTYDIEDAPSENIKIMRKKQNAFTISILVAIILSAVIGALLLTMD